MTISQLFRRIKKSPKTESPDGDHPYRGIRLVPQEPVEDLAYTFRQKAIAHQEEAIQSAIKYYINSCEEEANKGEFYHFFSDSRFNDKNFRQEVIRHLEDKGFRIVLHKDEYGFHVYW